jgi:hypothetical protein
VHRRERAREGDHNLNEVDMPLNGKKYSNFKLVKATVGRGLGSNEGGW